MRPVKSMLLVPLMLAAVAALGVAVCTLAGIGPAWRELALAAAVTLLAAEAALAPVNLLKGRDQATIAQAGLAGMVIQMLLGILLAAAVHMLGLVRLPTPFVWWMLVFYWVGLAVVAVAVIAAIRAAPPATVAAAKDAQRGSE